MRQLPVQRDGDEEEGDEVERVEDHSNSVAAVFANNSVYSRRLLPRVWSPSFYQSRVNAGLPVSSMNNAPSDGGTTRRSATYFSSAGDWSGGPSAGVVAARGQHQAHAAGLRQATSSGEVRGRQVLGEVGLRRFGRHVGVGHRAQPLEGEQRVHVLGEGRRPTRADQLVGGPLAQTVVGARHQRRDVVGPLHRSCTAVHPP